jgi:SAM-dependent methyltransferase
VTQSRPTVADPYDVVAYPGNALEQTHPDRLATLAHLFGMNPAPVDRCRVLELGCGDGGNLLPMALMYPNSRYVGIDLAGVPIAQAQDRAEKLGIANVDFRQLDVMDIDQSLGAFDYIIAHGLYSWVPDAVRDRILAVCAARLTARGVAYISYNTYPGCKIRELTGGMMRHHTRNLASPRERIDAAKALIRHLVAAKPENDLYRMLLAKELQGLEDDGDHSIFHDDLSPEMSPCYFHEFSARAATHGLQYVAEADYFEMQEHIWPESVKAALHGLSDRIDREQHLDFVKCRRFRQTLLCRSDVVLGTPQPDRLRACAFATQARAVSKHPNLMARTVEHFQGRRGSKVGVDLPVAKAALVIMAERWPQTVRFEYLLDSARERISASSSRDDDATALAGFLFAVYGAGLVETHLHPADFTLRPGSTPFASALARLQASEGPLVADLRHGMVKLEDERSRRLLTLMDGTRDHAALAGALAHSAGETLSAVQIASELPNVLARLAHLALIIA